MEIRLSASKSFFGAAETRGAFRVARMHCITNFTANENKIPSACQKCHSTHGGSAELHPSTGATQGKFPNPIPLPIIPCVLFRMFRVFRGSNRVLNRHRPQTV